MDDSNDIVARQTNHKRHAIVEDGGPKEYMGVDAVLEVDEVIPVPDNDKGYVGVKEVRLVPTDPEANGRDVLLTLVTVNNTPEFWLQPGTKFQLSLRRIDTVEEE